MVYLNAVQIQGLTHGAELARGLLCIGMNLKREGKMPEYKRVYYDKLGITRDDWLHLWSNEDRLCFRDQVVYMETGVLSDRLKYYIDLASQS